MLHRAIATLGAVVSARTVNLSHLAAERPGAAQVATRSTCLKLAAVTRRLPRPLVWTLIRGRGNSGTRQRIALMRRDLRLFEVSTIRLLSIAEARRGAA